jgi:hypothetical protein
MLAADTLAAVNARVDKALGDNRRAEWLVIGLAATIFLIGAVVLGMGASGNPYAAGAAVVVEMFLYWPVREILRIRRDNLILQTLPVLVSTMPPDLAAQELSLTLRKMWGLA